MKKIFLAAVVLLAARNVYASGSGTETSGVLETLRRENMELREKLLRQSAELERIKLFLAEIVSGEKDADAEKNGLKIRKFQGTVDAALNLAMQSDRISTAFRALLKELPLDAARRIQYTLLLDELDVKTRQLTRVAGKAAWNEGNRIIAMDPALNVVVLSGGLREGIAPGMVLRPVNDPDSPLRLRIFSVRPGVSAADLTGGSWGDLIPGMEFTPFGNNVRHTRR